MLKNSIDKIVKDKLKGIEIKPPVYVWSAINQRMLEGKRRKRILMYWQSAAAVAFLILSLGVIYFISDKNIESNQIVIVSNNEKNPDEDVKEKYLKGGGEQSDIQLTVVSDVDNEAVENLSVENVNTTSKIDIPDENERGNLQTNETGIKSNILLNDEPTKYIHLSKLKYFPVLDSHEQTLDTELIVPVRKKHSVVTLYAYNTELPVYKKTKIKKYKFILGGSVSPTYNYRNLGEVQSSSVVYSSDQNPANEEGIVSVSGGVNLRMEGKSRWSFETGILYSQVGQEVSQTTTYPSVIGTANIGETNFAGLKNAPVQRVSGLSNSLGEIRFKSNTPMSIEQNFEKSGVYLAASESTYDNQSEATTLRQLLDYIEVPLIVRYSVFKSKPAITLAGGLSTNFLIGNTAYLIENGQQENIGQTEGINSIAYSSTISIGVEFPFGKSFRFSLEPRFKYFLSPVNNKGFNDFRPYSIGVFGGLSFVFNNH